jgi:hypothetical protein
MYLTPVVAETVVLVSQEAVAGAEQGAILVPAAMARRALAVVVDHQAAEAAAAHLAVATVAAEAAGARVSWAQVQMALEALTMLAAVVVDQAVLVEVVALVLMAAMAADMAVALAPLQLLALVELLALAQMALFVLFGRGLLVAFQALTQVICKNARIFRTLHPCRRKRQCS